jgi:glutaminase
VTEEHRQETVEEADPVRLDAPPSVLGRVARAAERARILRGRIERARARHRSVDVALASIERDSTIGGGMLGGALAYRLFVFLLPLALVFVALVGVYAEASGKSTSEVVRETGLTGLIASNIASASSSSARWVILVVTLPVLLYVAGMLYRAIALTHAIAWHRSARAVKLTPRGFAAFGVVMAAQLTCVIAVGWIRQSDRLGLLAALVVYGVLAGGAWLVFTLQLPSSGAGWRILLPGAVLVGVGMLLVNMFNVYVTAWLVEERADTYGALGVATALLFSLYLIGRLIVGSAVLDATLHDLSAAGRGPTAAAPPRRVAAVADLDPGPGYVSTGRLPADPDVARLLEQTYERYRHDTEGEVSQVYPALAAVSGSLFGIAVVSTRGHRYTVGDADVQFAIMSVSKPFVFALACDALGPEEVRDRLGVNATGLPFNSLTAVERGDGRTNPMVNPGAIAATSLVPGDGPEARWAVIADGLSRFAGRPLALEGEVVESALATNARTHSIARLLASLGRIYCDPDEAADLYTRQCCLAVSAVDLAVMGATLADGGVNPVTRERVVGEDACRHTLAVMATAGLYESSGEWLYDVGLPGKSGIGGGIVTVAPGKGGMATFAPLLDAVGNSVKGQRATQDLSRRLGLDLFVSEPES